jgi:hypothetical protein
VADDCKKTGLGRVGRFHGLTRLTFRRQSLDKTIDVSEQIVRLKVIGLHATPPRFDVLTSCCWRGAWQRDLKLG